MLGQGFTFGKTTCVFFEMAGAVIDFFEELPNSIFNSIRRLVQKIVEHKRFDRMAELISLGNPIAIAPQLWTAWTAPPEALQGFSVSMFMMFLVLQGTMGLIFLKNKNRNMFFVMVSLVLITSATIIVTLIRR